MHKDISLDYTILTQHVCDITLARNNLLNTQQASTINPVFMMTVLAKLKSVIREQSWQQHGVDSRSSKLEQHFQEGQKEYDLGDSRKT